MIEYISFAGTKNFKNSDCKINLDIVRPLTTAQNKRAGTTNYISKDLPNNFDLRCLKIKENTKKGYALAKDGDGVYINRPEQKRGTVQKGMIQTLKTSVDDIGVVTSNLRIRKLTPLECFRLMAFSDEDYYKMKNYLSDSKLYHCMGDSIVVKVLEYIFKELF